MDNSSSQSKKTAENELNLFLDTQAGAKDAIELKALLNAYDAENGTPVRLPVREWPQRTSFHDVAIVSGRTTRTTLALVHGPIPLQFPCTGINEA